MRSVETAAQRHEKSRAHWAVNRALRTGRLVRPDHCERCGTDEGTVQGHHEDYAARLDVEWLCIPCHRALHAAQRRRGTPFADRFNQALGATTSESFARRIDRPLRTVQRWRAGTSEPYSASVILIARELDRDPRWFYPEPEEAAA